MNKREELLLKEVTFLRELISSLTRQNEKLTNCLAPVVHEVSNIPDQQEPVESQMEKRALAIEKHLSQIMGIDNEEEVVGQQ